MNGNGAASPRPVPEFDGGTAGPGGGADPAVTDDERNRYGALLDAAAERGLLTPTEYEARLGEVAMATSVVELRRIVTELPAFGASTESRTTDGSVPGSAAAPDRTPTAPDLDALLWAGRTQAVSRRNKGNQWLVLALVVAVLLVALVALGLVAAHVVHSHSTGAAAASRAAAAGLSFLRL